MDSDSASGPPAAVPRAGARWTWAAGLALILAGLLAYWNTFDVPLLLDDIASVAENPSIRRLSAIDEVLSPPSDVGFGGRPIANLTFALNYAAGGLAVRGYHVVNLAIHLAAALTLYGLLRLTFARPPLAAALPPGTGELAAFSAALLWLLHPLQTQAVTYLSQRTESLMGLFYLLTLYAFARGAVAGSRHWFVGSFAACALGMATKEVMVTAPLMVLLYDRTFISGSFAAAWRSHRRVYLALAATWLLLALLIIDVHERGVGYQAATAWEYALTQSRVVVRYLRLALWPSPLVFDYGPIPPPSFAAVWPHLTALLTLLAATAVALRRKPVLGFAAAWVFITLAPTSSIVPVGAQPMAEHRMYLPLVPLVAGLAGLLYARRPRAALVVSLASAVAAGYVSARRNHDYRDAVSLWADTAAKAPTNARAHAGLGAARLERGELAAAIAGLQRAVELDPSLAEAHNNLAAALVDAGRPADAIGHFTAALQLKPGVASTHYNFGNVLLQLGRVPEATAQQKQALLLRPELAEAECALANALAAADRAAEAIPHYEAALRRQPALTAASLGLAHALANTGRLAEAIPHYEATLRAVPNSAEAHFNLANALFGLRIFSDALLHYEATLQLQPGFAEAHNNAGNALAMLGRPNDALRHYEAALRADPTLAPARDNADRLRAAAVRP